MPKSANTRKGRLHGFTLVELLVALACLAAMGLMAQKGIASLWAGYEYSQASLDLTGSMEEASSDFDSDAKAAFGAPPLILEEGPKPEGASSDAAASRKAQPRRGAFAGNAAPLAALFIWSRGGKNFAAGWMEAKMEQETRSLARAQLSCSGPRPPPAPEIAAAELARTRAASFWNSGIEHPSGIEGCSISGRAYSKSGSAHSTWPAPSGAQFEPQTGNPSAISLIVEARRNGIGSTGAQSEFQFMMHSASWLETPNLPSP